MYTMVDISKRRMTWEMAYKCANKKLRREEKYLYRFKKWLLSLRWVNNWVWRRGCKVDRKPKTRMLYTCAYTGDKRGCREYTLTKGKNNITFYSFLSQGSTIHLPDYPSIRELDSTRPECNRNA